MRVAVGEGYAYLDPHLQKSDINHRDRHKANILLFQSNVAFLVATLYSIPSGNKWWPLNWKIAVRNVSLVRSPLSCDVCNDAN